MYTQGQQITLSEFNGIITQYNANIINARLQGFITFIEQGLYLLNECVTTEWLTTSKMNTLHQGINLLLNRLGYTPMANLTYTNQMLISAYWINEYIAKLNILTKRLVDDSYMLFYAGTTYAGEMFINGLR